MTPWIQILEGQKFDYTKADDPSQIHLRDISWALGGRCRFADFTKEHYSVAEHSVLMGWEALRRGHGPEIALWCGLHDATETYMPDLPRPWKYMPQIHDFIEEKEAELMRGIAERFDLQGREIPGIVKSYDNLILHDEALQVFDSPPIEDWHLHWAPGLGVKLQFWPKEKARTEHFKFVSDLLMDRVRRQMWR